MPAPGALPPEDDRRRAAPSPDDAQVPAQDGRDEWGQQPAPAGTPVRRHESVWLGEVELHGSPPR